MEGVIIEDPSPLFAHGPMTGTPREEALRSRGSHIPTNSIEGNALLYCLIQHNFPDNKRAFHQSRHPGIRSFHRRRWPCYNLRISAIVLK